MYPHQKKAIRSLIQQFNEKKSPAAVLLKQHFKAHKNLGGKDRRVIAQHYYTYIKNKLLLDACFPNAQDLEEPMLEALEYLDEPHREKRIAYIQQLASEHGIAEPSIKWSIPAWIYKQWEDDGKDAETLAIHALFEAKTYVRFNQHLLESEAAQNELIATEELQLQLDTITDTYFTEAKNLYHTNAYKQGLLEVQDYGSQEIARFCDVKPNDTVIDACSGAGGKALFLADLMKHTGKIWALDVRMKALENAADRADRAGYENIEFFEIPENPNEVEFPFMADVLLIDAPCSGSGTFARQADRKYQLTQEEVEKLVALQRNIVSQYSKWVKPGGKMIYATCSSFSIENERQRGYIEKNLDDFLFNLEQTIPPTQNHDGFYMAKFTKREA